MQYRIETLVAGTNTPLTTITNGRDFDVRVLVQDLRDDGNINRGVYAAYLDLLYDKSLGKVRVAEVQELAIGSGAPSTGSFTLTLNPGQTTAPINYTKSDLAANAGLIQSALNNLLGPNSVIVTHVFPLPRYQIQFVGQADIDQPMLQPSIANINVTEAVKGNPANANSFREAFRSRDLGLGPASGVPGPYQSGLSAINAIDRVDELGAQLDMTRLGNREFELVRARMTATLPPGQSTRVLTFTPDFSQINLPTHETLVYADLTTTPPEEDSVPFDAVVAVGTSLTINSVLSAASGVAQVGEDDLAGVSIPIIPLVTKNPGAPAGAIELRSFTQPAVGGTVERLDPNNTPTNFSDDLVRFIPAADFSGVATFAYTAGIVGDPIPADEATNTVTVTVNAVNDAPTNIVPGAQNTLEDTALVFSAANGNQIRVTDPDADPAGVRVTLSASTGAVTLAGTAGLTFTLGTGTSNSIMTFTGSTTDVNAALATLTYQPASNSTAPATLTITTADLVAGGSGGLKQDQDNVSITITGTNDPPVVAAPASQTAFTLNALIFSPAFNNAIVVSDLDAGTDSITVTLTAAGGIGTLTATDANGAQISGNRSANLSINGSQAAINAALNGLTLTPSSSATSGRLTISADDQGHNPGPALQGQAFVDITVSVPTGVFAVNDTPAGLIEGSASYTIDVLANDLATSDNSPIILSFTQPSVGTVTRDDRGTADPTDDRLAYRPPLKNGQPDLDFFFPGSAFGSFTYVVDQSPNPTGESKIATVTLRIANVADAPVANNDGLNNSYATSIGVPLTRTAAQGVLANDTSVDNAYGDPNVVTLTVRRLTDPLVENTTGGGTATINADGSFTYTPALGFSGNDTFTYRAINLGGGPLSTPATVTIHVSSPPTAAPDNFTTAQEDQVFTSPSSVLLNDSDFSDGEQLSAHLLTNVPPSAGAVSLSAAGIVTYTPALHFNTTRPPASPITFTYKVTTPSGRESAPATVSITVNDTNDNPTAIGDSFDAVQQKGQLGLNQTVPVLGNDSFAPDVQETLSVTAVNGGTGPSPTAKGGSVRLSAGQILYTSPATVTPVNDPDTFTYTISDGRGGTSTATVQVTVLPPFDYGDAVDTYGTTIFSNGARHFAIGPQLGLLRDEEGNGAPVASALGDDQADQDDEDGLTAHLLLRGKTSSFTVSVSSGPAKLDAWIDFNHNGTFDVAEQVATSVTVGAGANPFSTVSFAIPAAALLGPTTARFRLSTAGGAGPTGVAADGEVEDHIVTVLQDLEINLPTGNGTDRVSIRKSGADVEVFNIPSASVLGTSPLVFTHAVIVNGSASEADEITVDYAFGGFPTLPGGIHVDGGASGGDLLTIQGAAAGTNTAHYLSDGLSLGNATLRTSDGGTQSDVVFTNFEPLTVSGMLNFEAVGALNVGVDTLTLLQSNLSRLVVPITLAGGTINAANGIFVDAGGTLRGHGTVNGPLSIGLDSILEATGPLTLGNANSNSGFSNSGTVHIGSNSVTILSAMPVELRGLTTLGSGSSGGTLNVANGLVLLNPTSTIQGLGTINTPNNAAAAIDNRGIIKGNSAGEKLTLTGFVTGRGTLDNVIITGTYSPGASPAAVQLGSLSFSPTAKLIIELGGKTAGSQYDQLNLSGAAVLGGTLEVILLNGFVPAIPDAFVAINAAAGVTGAFSTVTLPALTGRQRWWETTPVGNELRLLVSPTHPRHNPRKATDVNDDKSVAAGDALDIINFINAFRSQAVAPSPVYINPFLDVDGNNFVSANDALEIINLINAGLAGPYEGESGPITSVNAGPSANLAPSQADNSGLADVISLLALDLSEQALRRRRSH